MSKHAAIWKLSDRDLISPDNVCIVKSVKTYSKKSSFYSQLLIMIINLKVSDYFEYDKTHCLDSSVYNLW